jgi:exopolysaccharide biosynthesis polyprenyl glycosylphosphotransferase
VDERPGADNPLLRLALDVALTLVALYLASVLRPWLPLGRAIAPEYTRLPVIMYGLVVLVWSLAFLLLSVYRSRILRIGDEVQLVIAAATLATLTLSGFLYFSFRDVSRLQVATFYLLDLLLLTGYRLIFRWFLRLRGQPPYPRRRVLVLGAGQAGQDVMRMVAGQQWAGLEPVGFLDDEIPSGTEVMGVPVLGRLEGVAHFVETEGIGEVVVSLPVRDYDQFFHLIGELQGLPARIRIVPDYIKTALFRTRVEDLANVPMITLQQPGLEPFERQVKRAFDLVMTSLLLLIGWPALALIAVAIRLDSRGPALYRQQRLGEGGRTFWMYKFRSMVVGAEEMDLADNGERTDDRAWDKRPDDPRITRVGKVLRRMSLDELPQLLNVLKGEMSLVGPRPELPGLAEKYEPWQWQRFAVPQGMTGWWQVRGRVDQPMYLHPEEDMFYVQHYSLLLDIQIMWRTIGAVLRGEGAY